VSAPVQLARPKPADVVGRYTVQDSSRSLSDRGSLHRITLTVRPDESYSLEGPRLDSSSSILELGSEGRWKLTSMHGLDFGSRASWGLRFSDSTSAVDAYCLDGSYPGCLLFVDYSRRKLMGEWLLFSKARPKELTTILCH
jgi:hypothetical protein